MALLGAQPRHVGLGAVGRVRQGRDAGLVRHQRRQKHRPRQDAQRPGRAVQPPLLRRRLGHADPILPGPRTEAAPGAAAGERCPVSPPVRRRRRHPDGPVPRPGQLLAVPQHAVPGPGRRRGQARPVAAAAGRLPRRRLRARRDPDRAARRGRIRLPGCGRAGGGDHVRGDGVGARRRPPGGLRSDAVDVLVQGCRGHHPGRQDVPLVARGRGGRR